MRNLQLPKVVKEEMLRGRFMHDIPSGFRLYYVSRVGRV